MKQLPCVLALCAVLGPSQAPARADEAKTGFVYKTFNDNGTGVKYAVFVPKDYDGKKTYPVILFLHGAGETGTDGKKQATVGLPKAIRNAKERFGFITVMPQSQKGGWRADGPEGKRAMAILEEVEKSYKTDRKRVYLTGLSMGGSGTWGLAAAHPQRWAAIAPICGGGSPDVVKKIKGLPCWAFCGDKERPKTLQNIRALVKALKDAGAEVRYTEYPGVGHNSWDRAYATAELYSWFLKHAKK